MYNGVIKMDFFLEWIDIDMNGVFRVFVENVEEDMFLLYQIEEGYFLDVFVCCFFLGFDLLQKLGKFFKDIYGLVFFYEKIGLSMERFFS